MGIQTKYRSFNNRWTISSRYHFQVQQQCSQRRFQFSQTALQRFKVLPGLSLVIPGAPRLVVGTPRLVVGAPRLVVGASRLVVGPPRLVVGPPRLVAGAPRCSQVHPKFSPALRGVLKHITLTPMAVLYQSWEMPVTPKAGRNALIGSDFLLKLTHLSLHSTSSQTPLESCIEDNAFCWCRQGQLHTNGSSKDSQYSRLAKAHKSKESSGNSRTTEFLRKIDS